MNILKINPSQSLRTNHLDGSHIIEDFLIKTSLNMACETNVFSAETKTY